MNKEENYSEWYNNIVRAADIIDDRFPIKGMPVYKQYGYSIIRYILKELEILLDNNGFYPSWFPNLIPYDIFKKESEHIKGFENEVFYVTPAKPVEEERDIKYILRPTSETEMYYMFSLWIKSFRDLPLLTYMTNTVYRYETKATKPLIRGRELLWNEAHTAHRDLDDAILMINKSKEIYSNLFWNRLHIPHFWVKRPDWDKFAGADFTYAAETILPDGRFLQIGTTHLLGRNFSRAYDIIFEDEHPFIKIDKDTLEAYDQKNNKYLINFEKNQITIKYIENNEIKLVYQFQEHNNGDINEGNKELMKDIENKIKSIFNNVELKKQKYVWQTSFGLSMRTLAALISIHGDNKGLILPFDIAPIQIIIIPVYYSDEDKNKVIDYSIKIYNLLRDKYRVKIDFDDSKSPGWKFNNYELLGVPLRITIGKREIEDASITISIRMYNEKYYDFKADIDNLGNTIKKIIEIYENKIIERAKNYLNNKIFKTNNVKDIENNLNANIVFKAPFCMKEDCAENVKKNYSLDIRGTDINPETAEGKCIFCNNDARYYVYIGKSY